MLMVFLLFDSVGHYISDLCSAEGVWHSYNDCHVNEVREEDIRQRRQRTGYIFFYMHKSVDIIL